MSGRHSTGCTGATSFFRNRTYIRFNHLDSSLNDVSNSLSEVKTITPTLIGTIESGYAINVQVKNSVCYVSGGIKLTNNTNSIQDVFSGLPTPKIQNKILFAISSNSTYGYGEVSTDGVLSCVTNTSNWARFNFSYLV